MHLDLLFFTLHIFIFILSENKQGWQHRGELWGHGPPLFCVAKRKKGDKGKKESVSKQKLLKGCHQGQNIIVLTIF